LLAVVTGLGTGCQSCNAVEATSVIVIQLQDVAKSRRAPFTVHGCYGATCVDKQVVPDADSQPALFIPLDRSPSPAETLHVEATDTSTGERFIDASLNLEVPQRTIGGGGCTSTVRSRTVLLTSDGQLKPYIDRFEAVRQDQLARTEPARRRARPA
jgi:hypothetical protein